MNFFVKIIGQNGCVKMDLSKMTFWSKLNKRFFIFLLILWFRKPWVFVVIWWIFNGSMISWQVKITSTESNMEKMIMHHLASGIKGKEPTYFQFWYKMKIKVHSVTPKNTKVMWALDGTAWQNKTNEFIMKLIYTN
jgi:hypothetical protein